jgi:hypothetical protein
MNASRWLTWTPKNGSIIQKMPEPNPPKPPETPFEGFEGAISGETQIISRAERGCEDANTASYWRTPSGKLTNVFPHCPACCSFALYLEDNLGAYECQTCGLENIDEEIARRLM